MSGSTAVSKIHPLHRVRVLITNDRPWVTRLLVDALQSTERYCARGSNPSLPDVVQELDNIRPKILLIGMDVDGNSQIVKQLMRVPRRDAQMIVLLTKVTGELVLEAISAGAKGIVSADDGLATLVECLDAVANNQLYLRSEHFVTMTESLCSAQQFVTRRELSTFKGVVDTLAQNNPASLHSQSYDALGIAADRVH